MDTQAFTELSVDAPFYFACRHRLSCFNMCCRDLNQFLTPYDVLRLKHHFHLSSTEFLERYTARHVGPQTGLPVVTIIPGDRFERICPFVSEAGCRVYENRPSSCRIYPLIRVLSQSRQDGKREARYALLHEKHCRGFTQKHRMTVREWTIAQGLEPYNDANDLMMDIIHLKNQYLPGPLAPDLGRVFYILCYDMDRLKDRNRPSGLEDLEVSDAILSDDETLLGFCMNYLTTLLSDASIGASSQQGPGGRR